MARVRDKSTTFSVQRRTKTIGPSGTSTTFDTFSTVNRNVMTDEVVTRFKSRSANGEIFINPMERQIRTTELHPVNNWAQHVRSGKTYRTERDYVNHTYKHWAPWEIWASGDVREAVERCEGLAITDAYAGVGTADVATLTELAELRETLGFLWSPVSKLKQLTKRLSSYIRRCNRMREAFERRLAKWEALPAHVKKRRPKPATPVYPTWSFGKWSFNDVASAWLAYRYAVMPILYTIQGIQAHLERQVYPERATARATSRATVSISQVSGWTQYTLETGKYSQQSSVVGNAEVVSRAGVLYSPDWSLNRQLGLQIHQVPMALYEAVPLSFVTDWFHNAADYYNALTAELRALKIYGAWVTTTVMFDAGAYLKSRADTPGTTTFTSDLLCCTIKGEWKIRRRVSLADVRLRLRVEMNGKRVADAFALIYTMLATARKSK